ncbi:helix-turn-helix domain-containing protein [Brachyspira innocens]|uniref:helix-turn-helix domain-containing protein n=1 Tax=Brachyspira innocens TaxID=13264 RepID=UPI00037A5E2D|nr:XRE family transcriptional regulator [Brachyspira innocens]
MENIINGNRIKKARLYNGLTVEDISKKLDISKQTFSLYENNKINAPFEKIFLLSKELNFPIQYFYEKDNVNIDSKTTYFRSLMKTTKKYRVEQIVKMEHLGLICNVLFEYINFPKLNLPSIKYKNNLSKNDIENIAQNVRDYWNLGTNPIDNIIRVVEENGIIVTKFETSTNDIDAFSHLVDIDNNSIYLIALSKNKDSLPRNKFDVAHELGHILLHEWSEDIESISREEYKLKEEEANYFASSFLLPKDEFIKDFKKGGNRLEFYIHLKSKWKVSIGAMLYRAKYLGLITNTQYQNTIKIMNKKGILKKEPYDELLGIYEPTLLIDSINLILTHIMPAKELMKEFSNNNISMNAKEIEKLLNLKEGTLSVNQEVEKIIDENNINKN